MGILNNTHVSGLVPAPWQTLLQYGNRTRIYRVSWSLHSTVIQLIRGFHFGDSIVFSQAHLQDYENALRLGQQLVKNFNFDFDLESLANLLLLNVSTSIASVKLFFI